MFFNLITCISGTTTTGNTCREGFKKPKKFAAILGIPVWIVRNHATILAVISDKKASINADAFEDFCDDHLEKLKESPIGRQTKFRPFRRRSYL